MFVSVASEDMESMRSTWTDSRLDDLNRRVEAGFAKVDQDLRELRTEMNSRFDALHHTMIHFGASLIASFAGLVLAFVLTQA